MQPCIGIRELAGVLALNEIYEQMRDHNGGADGWLLEHVYRTSANSWMGEVIRRIELRAELGGSTPRHAIITNEVIDIPDAVGADPDEYLTGGVAEVCSVTIRGAGEDVEATFYDTLDMSRALMWVLDNNLMTPTQLDNARTALRMFNRMTDGVSFGRRE